MPPRDNNSRRKPAQAGGKQAGGKQTGAKAGEGGKDGSAAGARMLTTRVKTAANRTVSSTRWLQRQLNDPYVANAKQLGYRSRAAFKLLQLDDRFEFLKPGGRVVDLGAAPGGWTQIAVARVNSARKKGHVVGIDILDWDPVPGAITLVGDFLDPTAPGRIEEALGGQADVVLSDMAAPTTGHSATDHLRIMHMCEVALDFAVTVLAPGGTFVAKVFKGGSEQSLLAALKLNFQTVRHAKPPASRKESAETYVVATGFRGKNEV